MASKPTRGLLSISIKEAASQPERSEFYVRNLKKNRKLRSSVYNKNLITVASLYASQQAQQKSGQKEQKSGRKIGAKHTA